MKRFNVHATALSLALVLLVGTSCLPEGPNDASPGPGPGPEGSTPSQDAPDGGTGQVFSPAQMLEVGGNTMCATDENGVLFCAGSNWLGKRGFGSLGGTAGGSLNAQVATLPALGFKRVEIGRDHACALTVTNQLYCWGGATFGQIIRNDVVNCEPNTLCSTVPRPVDNLVGSEVIDFVAGGRYTCIRTVDQPDIFSCRGQDYTCDFDIVADNRPCPSNTSFTEIAWKESPDDSLELVASDASGSGFCWVTSDGAAACHSNPFSGSAGFIERGTHVVATNGIVDVSVQYSYYCLLKDDGTVHCGGQADGGVLGIDPETADPVAGGFHPPRQIGDITDAIAIDGTCIIRSDDTVWCWGENRDGILGVEENPDATGGTTPDAGSSLVLTPSPVVGLGPVEDLASSSATKCAREIGASNITCWGAWARFVIGGSARRQIPPQEIEFPEDPVYAPEAEEVGAIDVEVVAINRRASCPSYPIYVGPGPGGPTPTYVQLAGSFTASGDPGPGCSSLPAGGSVIRSTVQISEPTFIYVQPDGACSPPVAGIATPAAPGDCIRVELQ